MTDTTATNKRVRQVRTAPPTYQIIVLSVWATLLVLVGLAVATRVFIALEFAAGMAWWYGPTVTIAGAIGIGLTILALGAARRRFLPWLLLPGASGAIAVSLLLTGSAS